MVDFEKALDQFLKEGDPKRPWSDHFPDELFCLINSAADFELFLRTLAQNLDGDMFEVECPDIFEFILQLNQNHHDHEVKQSIERLSIKSHYGAFAYRMTLALADPIEMLSE